MDNADLPRIFLVDDLDLFPSSFLGLSAPSGVVFVAVEGQSTDDGKVFVNTLGDQDDIGYAATTIRRSELDSLIAQAKIHFKGKAFKQAVAEDESEHGLAYWNLDDERSVVMVFSTLRSSMLEDKAIEWLGTAQASEAPCVFGCGLVGNTGLAELDALKAVDQLKAKTRSFA